MALLGLDGSSTPHAFYVRRGPTRFTATRYAQGAWRADEQHMGAASGVLLHEIERRYPRDDVAISRVSFDILGVIGDGDFDVSTKIERRGRTIELIAAELIFGEVTAIRAHVWRLLRGDTEAIAGAAAPALPAPETAGDAPPWRRIWPGGFIENLDVRPLPGREPGRARAWVSSAAQIVDGEPSSELCRLVALVDTANGIAPRADPGAVMFPNVDLTIHVFRQPVGAWLGLDTQVSFGPTGLGLTQSTLHDERGAWGQAAQSLTVRPLRRHANG